MKGNGRITGYAVNKKTISVQVELSGAMAVVDELERYKGRMKTIRLDTFQVVGKIESITIRRSVGFLIHAARLDFINRRLFRSDGEGASHHRGEHDTPGQAALPPRYGCREAGSEAGGPPVRADFFQEEGWRRTGKDNSRARGRSSISRRPSRASSSTRSGDYRPPNRAEHVRDVEDNIRDSPRKGAPRRKDRPVSR